MLFDLIVLLSLRELL